MMERIRAENEDKISMLSGQMGFHRDYDTLSTAGPLPSSSDNSNGTRAPQPPEQDTTAVRRKVCSISCSLWHHTLTSRAEPPIALAAASPPIALSAASPPHRSLPPVLCRAIVISFSDPKPFRRAFGRGAVWLCRIEHGRS